MRTSAIALLLALAPGARAGVPDGLGSVVAGLGGSSGRAPQVRSGDDRVLPRVPTGWSAAPLDPIQEDGGVAAAFRRARAALRGPTADAAAAWILARLAESDRADVDAALALDAALGPPTYVLGPLHRALDADDVLLALVAARRTASRHAAWAASLRTIAVRDARYARAALVAGALAEAPGRSTTDDLVACAPGSPRTRSAVLELAFRLEAERCSLARTRWLSDWARTGEAAGTHPVEASWPAMQTLSAAGELRAAWWSWVAAADLDVPATERADLRERQLEMLRSIDPDATWPTELAREAPAVATPTSRDPLVALLTHVADTSRVEDVRAWCLFSAATLLSEVAPVDDAAAVALLERIAKEHVRHELATVALGAIFRLEHLSIGDVVPTFDRPDVLGRTIDLASKRGRVVVLAFYEDGPFVERDLLTVLDQLVLLYPRSRFEVVAVNVDPDVDAARDRLLSAGREWEASYQGARSGPWPAAWGIRSFPSVFVLDRNGVIRARDVFGGRLTSAVLDLIGAR
ncbi:MAG: hypothetical protein R3F34_09555 [Planctomycetota bacterium]